MIKVYERIKKYALTKSKEKSVVTLIIFLGYRIFSNEIIVALISLFEPLVIGIMANLEYYGFFFYLCVIIYIMCVLFGAYAMRFQKEQLQENRMLKQALIGGIGCLRAWATGVQQCAKAIFKLNRKSQATIERIIESIDFQAAAFHVCTNLCNNLCKYYENSNIYITVFQKQETPNGSICKMIAYSGNHEPSTYGQPYNIPDVTEAEQGKVEYHSFLFAMNKTDISVLPNRDSIEKCFINHPKSEERENEIQQYICVPIAPAGLGVTFLLQVDTNIADLFGKDKNSVTSFAETAIYPFAQFLHMVYEQGRLIEQVIKEVRIR